MSPNSEQVAAEGLLEFAVLEMVQKEGEDSPSLSGKYLGTAIAVDQDEALLKIKSMEMQSKNNLGNFLVTKKTWDEPKAKGHFIVW